MIDLSRNNDSEYFDDSGLIREATEIAKASYNLAVEHCQMIILEMLGDCKDPNINGAKAEEYIVRLYFKDQLNKGDSNE